MTASSYQLECSLAKTKFKQKQVQFISLLLFFLLIIKYSQEQCPNKAFPKIFGGSLYTTEFYQIDFHEGTNKFVTVGTTGDSDLIGSTPCNPINPHLLLIMYSASTFVREWAKVFSQCTAYWKYVAFSSDGLYIIAQNDLNSVSVFDNLGSHVKSVMVSGKFSISEMVRGLLIDAQSTRSAYVVDVYKQTVNAVVWQGFRFFKFPIATSVSIPTYYMYSQNIDNTDRGNSIKFGDTEDYIYLYAKYSIDKKVMITRLQTIDGAILWNYGYTYTLQNDNMGFEYKNMGAGKEIIGTASGCNTGVTYFGRLIIQDGAVQSRDLFIETLSMGNAMKAMRIIDEETFVIATYITASDIQIETLSFGTILTQSIKKTIPAPTSTKFNFGKFISDTNFIGIGSGKSLYLKYGSANLNMFASAQQQGILYSSDPDQTCQIFSSDVPIVRPLTKTVDGISDMSTEVIFMISPPTMTLTAHTTSTVITINTLKLISDDNFCANIQLVTNATSVVISQQFSAGTMTVLNVHPFEIVSFCSSDTFVATYTMTMDNLAVLNPIFTFDQNAAALTALTTAPKGTFNLLMKATIAGRTEIYQQSYSFLAVNTAPYFVDATYSVGRLTTGISVPLNSVGILDLPWAVNDPEGNAVTVTGQNWWTQDQTLVSRIIVFSFNGTHVRLTITPVLFTDVMSPLLKLWLSDAYGSNQYMFYYGITNSAPSFKTALVAQTVPVNSVISYTLPAYSDPEGHTASVSCFLSDGVTAVPDFIVLTPSTFTFTISPKLMSTVGITTVKVNLFDGQPATKSYTFTVTVTNTAPVFNPTTLIDQTVTQHYSIDYAPGVYDAEGNALEYSTGTLPNFVTIANGIFTIHPTLTSEIGTHSVSVSISDTLLSSVTKNFIITVLPNLPPIFSVASLTAQTVALNSKQTYSLPSCSDPEGNAVSISFEPANIGFISISANILLFEPTTFAQTGVHTITVILNDGKVTNNYQFDLIVTNSAPMLNDATITQTVALNSVKSYTLTGFTDAEGHTITINAVKQPTTSLPSFIVFTQPTFTFSPTSFSEIGPHVIEIKLTDTQVESQAYTFIVTVTNSAPLFTKLPVSQTLALNSVKGYTLTDFIDSEGNPITILPIEQGSLTLPTFVTFIQPTFIFSPTLFTEVKTTIIEIKLTDTQATSIAYTFEIIVTNTAPYFTSVLPSIQVVSMNSVLNYALPPYTDAEGNPIFVKIVSSGQSFASTQSGGIIKFAPINFIEVKTHTIEIQLFDGQPLNSQIYSFDLNVINTAPIFDSTVISDQNVKFNSLFNYPLPPYHDPEGSPVTISIFPFKSFIKISADKLSITFNPVNFVDVGTHYLKLTLSDGQPQSTDYLFTVTFPNTPPLFVDKKPENKVVRLNEDFRYKLPQYLDPEGSDAYVNIDTKATFITLIDTDVIKINPTEFSYLGTHTVTVALSDGEPKTEYYQFQVTVTNTPPKFLGALPSNQELHFNEVKEYDLPAFSDLENNPVIVENKLPPFVEFKENRYYITPTALSHIGTFTVTGALKDQVSQTLFSFDIKVLNEAPYFSSDPVDQTVNVGQSITYQLPSTGDRENLPVKVLLTLAGQNSLPQFMNYENNILTVSPINNIFHSGVYKLQASLSDGQASPKFYQFKVKSIKSSNEQGSDGTIVRTSTQKSTNDFLSSLTEASKDGSKKQVQIFKATIKLAQATRDGQLKIQISSNKDVSGIIKNIQNADLQFNLITQGKITVNFTMKVKEVNLGYFKVLLKFQNPQQISNANEPDIIEMKLLNDVISQTANTVMLLPAKQTSRITLPPQLSETTAKLAENFKSGTNIAAVMALPGGLLINLTLSMCIQYLWGMLNDLSFLTILTMISMTLPGIAQMIQQAMLNFIYLDLLMTDQWLVPLFFSDQNEVDIGTPLNQQFDENGFSSTILIKNLGSTFVYLLMLICCYFVYLFLSIISRFYPKMGKYRDKLGGILFWNTPIRFMIQQFPPLFLASLVNLYGLSFETLGTQLSSCMSILILFASPISMILITGIIYKGRRDGTIFGNENYDSKFGTITEGLNPKSGFIGAYWSVIVLVRWALTSIVLVSIRDHPQFQIMSMLCVSIVFQALIIVGNPMKGPEENRMSFLNELMVSTYLYIAISLTDFQGENTLRAICGWALATVVVVSSIMNLLKFKITITKVSIKLCQKRKYIKAVAKKYQMQQVMEEHFKKQLILEEFKVQERKQAQEKEELQKIYEKNYYGSTHYTFLERQKAFHSENKQNLAFNQERLDLMNHELRKKKDIQKDLRTLCMERDMPQIEDIEDNDDIITQDHKQLNENSYSNQISQLNGVNKKEKQFNATFGVKIIKYPDYTEQADEFYNQFTLNNEEKTFLK